MDTRPLRVRLDLAKVNAPSYRRYVWYPVSPCALSTIADLKANICRKFNLCQREVLLFVDGGLMRDEDTVLLLRENDVVQVVYTHEYELQGDNQPVYEDFMDMMPPEMPVQNVERNRNITIADTVPEKKKKKRKKKLDDVNGVGSCDQLNSLSSLKRRKKLKITKSLSPSTSQQAEKSLDDHNEQLPSDNKAIDRNATAETPTVVEGELETSGLLMVCDKNETFDITISSVPDEDNFILPSGDVSLLHSVTEDGNDSSGNNVIHLTANDTIPTLKESTTMAVDSVLSTAESKPDGEKSFNESRSTNCKKRKRKRKRKHAKDLDISISFPLPSNDCVVDADMNSSEGNTHVKFTSEFESEVKSNINRSSSFQNGYTEKADLGASGDPENLDSAVAVDDQQSEPLAEGYEESGYLEKYSTPSATTTKAQGNTVSAIKPDYSQYHSLNTMPQVGTYIAFKVLELSELYCPEITDYKEGLVAGYDSESDSLIIVLSDEEMKGPRIGKFENIYKDDSLEPVAVQKIVKKWNELIDPKLLQAPE